MKCYYCAEEINAEATRCRFCGQDISPANRIGLPSWYRHTGSTGLGLTWIEMDLEAKAFSGNTGNLVLLNGHNMVPNAYGCTGDDDEYDGFKRYRQFVQNRCTEIHGNPTHALESAFLLPLLRYYYTIETLVKNSNHWQRDANLIVVRDDFLKAMSHKSLEVLPTNLRKELVDMFQQSATEMEKIREILRVGAREPEPKYIGRSELIENYSNSTKDDFGSTFIKIFFGIFLLLILVFFVIRD